MNSNQHGLIRPAEILFLGHAIQTNRQGFALEWPPETECDRAIRDYQIGEAEITVITHSPFFSAS